MKAALVVITVTLANAACSKSNNADSGSSADISASGTAAGAAGGALSGANSNGTQAAARIRSTPTFFAQMQRMLNPLPRAYASVACPTWRDTGSDCTTSSSSMWLAYDDCTFTGRADWNGVQELKMSSGAASCGTFPNPGASGTLYRQVVTAAGANVPGSLTIAADDLVATVDDASANLANFDGDTITAVNGNGGYGAAVSFGSNSARDSVTVGRHISVPDVFDHSVSGTLAITENPGASSRVLNGSIKVYHNLLRIIGTAVFNEVIHEDICCLPVGGSITTTFSAGQNVSPTVQGSNYIGKSEVLTFTGCGTATLQEIDGTVENVTLSRCF